LKVWPFKVGAATLALIMVTAGAAAAQGWDTYDYPDAQFAIQFPAPPSVTRGTYRTTTGLNVPATTYAARDGAVAYALTIADFTGAAQQDDAAIKDAVALFGRRGEVKVDVEARINREYGRELSVVGADGARSIGAIFFFGGKLYVLEGRAAPPNADDASAGLIRFQQSLQFAAP
jgi:hypothetical protein